MTRVMTFAVPDHWESGQSRQVVLPGRLAYKPEGRCEGGVSDRRDGMLVLFRFRIPFRLCPLPMMMWT